MSRVGILQTGALLACVIAIPGAALWIVPRLAPMGHIEGAFSGGSSFESSTLRLEPRRIGPEPDGMPLITNVGIVDLDQDGMNDVLVCDSRAGRVLWYRQAPGGAWEERVLGEDLVAPAHATALDIDGDDDLDVVVSVLGNLMPDDGVIGRVVLLENDGDAFKARILLDDVRRVADVQGGDLDGDGDVDLAVAVFGYSHGQILWLENDGSGRFREHELLASAGTIHVPLADYDGDGDLDIAAVVSQNDEEVWGFENLGGGAFEAHRLYYTTNFDIGTAGLVQTDLDGDGDPDLLLPVGDNMEDIYSYPQPYHGCLWLENKGGWKFETKRIATFGGTYAAGAGDLDADGDQDVVLVSMVNEWDRPENASIVWLENDGSEQFRTWQIDESPTHLITVACGDLDADGRADIVAGGCYTLGPLARVGRVTAWMSGSGSKRAEPRD